MKIGIFYKEKNLQIVDVIVDEALRYGFEIDDDNPDIVFSVGGDGTFLKAVHKYLDRLDDIFFVGVNGGSLGFFYEFSKDDIGVIFSKIETKSYKIKEHTLLKGLATYNKSKEEIYALNEIRMENPFHTLISNVSINGEELETFRGNGLIVSSSIGSSAYNKSLGGALIDSDIEALELTEVAGISNNAYRSLGSSLVIKGDKNITLSCEVNNAVVGYDHLNINKDDELVKLDVCYSDKKARIIYSEDHSYVQKIRKSFVL